MKRLYVILVLLLCVGGALFLLTMNSPSFITITEDMVINETGSGDHMNWFDEQALDSEPQTYFDTYGMQSYWPAGVIVDFKEVCKLKTIWIFDAKESNRRKGGYLKISMGTPFNWGESIIVELNNKNEWIKVQCPFKTQFIQIEKHATVVHEVEGYFPQNYDLAVNEILFFGSMKNRSEKSRQNKYKSQLPKTTMERFIGMNSYIYTPDKVHEAVGTVREYRGWSVNGVLDLNEPISWEPKPNAGVYPTDGDGDSYYKKMMEMGIDCMPCIHRHVDLNQGENIPNFGGDPSKPETYRVMADYSFQFVARYGAEKVDESKLRTTEPSPKKSGLGYIKYFENWNEGDRWWSDPAGHFTPYQFAAYCSATYDGHLGALGEGMGAKTADPNMMFSFGGLAELGSSYVEAMKLWSDTYREGVFPSDIINLHHYCNTRGKQHDGGQAFGVSPEADKIKEKLEKIVQWRNRYLPHVEIWLSEFGWDTNPDTYQSAAFGHKLYPEGISMNEIQAQWLTRIFLIGSAAGIERMQMFLANDLRDYHSGVYGFCGFITVDDEYKPSWYYIKTLKTALTDMVFEKEIESSNPNVWIYSYIDSKSNRGAYVLWCPTSDGTTVNSYKLQLLREIKGATLISLKDKEEIGVHQKLEISNDHSITVDVSERPVIVYFER